MKTLATGFAALLMLYTSSIFAEPVNQPYYSTQPNAAQQPQQSSYGSKVGRKAANGAINMVTSPLEIPKAIINDMNAEWSNFAFGIVGGVLEGSLNTVFRTVTGGVDLVTAPVPTKPITQPQYVWDDFYEENTRYGNVFRLDNDGKPAHFAFPSETTSRSSR